MTPERLAELLDQFPRLRIAVIGDFFLDKYLDVDPDLGEPSVETGKIAHQVVGVRCSPGAAGTVVNNLAALDAGTLRALGAIGDDGESYELVRALERRGCATAGLLRFPNLFTPTYLKPRDFSNPDLTGEHSRYDTKNRRPTPTAIHSAVLEELDRVLPELDGVVIADQVNDEDCGVVTAQMREELADRALRFPQIHFWADSRRKIAEFRHVWIKPNQFEAMEYRNPRPGESFPLERLAQRVGELHNQGARGVCLTTGDQGALVSEWASASNSKAFVEQSDVSAQREAIRTRIEGVRLEGPIDTTGAGDSFTAGAILSLCAGASLSEAALVGILVSSITVQQLATTGVASRAALQERLTVWRDQRREG